MVAEIDYRKCEMYERQSHILNVETDIFVLIHPEKEKQECCQDLLTTPRIFTIYFW